MAVDKAKLRSMAPDDLVREELELREAIWKLRLQRSTGQLQDPHRVRRTRKDLARVKSIRRELELAKEKGR